MQLNPRMKSILAALVIAIVCGAAVAGLQNFKLVEAWELKTYDWRMTTLPPTKHDDVVLVYVDQGSLTYMESMGVGWPWPRELYAPALNFLKRGGAKLVFFDIFFSEDSVYGVADDEKFARGIEAGPPAYFAVFATARDIPPDERQADVLEKMTLEQTGELPIDLPEAKALQSLPIPPIARAALAFGNVQSPPDDDGVYRRVHLLTRLGDSLVPSIALKVAADRHDSRATWDGNELTIGSRRIPVDETGSMLIRYPGSLHAFPVYSVGEILASAQQLADGETPRIDPNVFKDKIVVGGLSAPGLFDLKPSPIARITPGPFIHAAAIANLLAGDAIAPSPLAVRIAFILLVACAAALGLTFIARWWSIALFIGGIAVVVTALCTALFHTGLWLPLVPPLLAGILSSTAALTKNYLTEGRTKRAIKNAFGQYIAPEVVDQIAQDPENIRMEGKKKELTILFTDIANFTSIAEGMKPEELVTNLNGYLTAMTRTILNTKGTLDKYIGDAIMAFWGAPLDLPDHARRAIEAALAMQEELKHFPAFATRIGIHTGEVVVGNIGSDLRFNYTVIGDAVNLASRLEGLNKYLGSRVLLSETTERELSTDLIRRRVGRVRVKGRSEPIDIYEPLGFEGGLSKTLLETCVIFEDGLGSFDSGRFDEALEHFVRVGELSDDPVARFYRDRCLKFRDEPPAKPFDGVIDFKTK